MKSRWIIIPGLLALIAAGVAWLVFHPNPYRIAAEQTCHKLHEEGFKVGLSEFELGLSAEEQTRFTLFTNAALELRDLTRPAELPTMRPVGSNSAQTVWRERSLPAYYSLDTSWQEVRADLSQANDALNQASVVLLESPLRSAPRQAGTLLYPHLADLKMIGRLLGVRVVVTLHNGDPAEAWNDLLALTRLATEWQLEPFDIAHAVRFSLMEVAYETTWEAMQANEWSDQQLKMLQDCWEGANLWEDLPETAALSRVVMLEILVRQRNSLPRDLLNVLKLSGPAIFKSPGMVWSDIKGTIKAYWTERDYWLKGSYEDEVALLHYFRDRELELRTAVMAPNWAQMRACPGVTNNMAFQGAHPSRIQAVMNLQQMNRAYGLGWAGLPGQAAEAEARRRLLITAIAMKRWHRQHESYPEALDELTPDFVEAVPVDFMDNRPLRYQATDDGRFLLYSIGLDCVDEGGLQAGPKPVGVQLPARTGDLLWPLPATEQEMESYRNELRRVQAWIKGESLDEIPEAALKRHGYGGMYLSPGYRPASAPPPLPSDGE